MSEIQTTTTVRTTLPQSVFQSTKVPARDVSNAREQMEIKLKSERTRERFLRTTLRLSFISALLLVDIKSHNEIYSHTNPTE